MRYYTIVQYTRREGLQHSLRLLYLYINPAAFLEHLDWARNQFALQVDLKEREKLLVSIECDEKTTEKTGTGDVSHSPHLDKFFLPAGEKIPVGGHEFKSI